MLFMVIYRSRCLLHNFDNRWELGYFLLYPYYLKNRGDFPQKEIATSSAPALWHCFTHCGLPLRYIRFSPRRLTIISEILLSRLLSTEVSRKSSDCAFNVLDIAASGSIATCDNRFICEPNIPLYVKQRYLNSIFAYKIQKKIKHINLKKCLFYKKINQVS